MEFTRVFDIQLKLLVTTIEGEITDQNLLKHVNELNDEGVGIVGLRELVDCRGITSLARLTVSGTTIAGGAQEDKPGSMLAILVRPDDPLLFGMARAFQMFSEEVRHKVGIFTELGACIGWFVGEDERGTSISDFFEQQTR